MAKGDLYEATAGESSDLYYVDVGMYDVPEYGCAYIIDDERPALVDTGIGYRPELVLDGMAEVGIAPEDLAVIAPTHVHLDHAGGTGYLVEDCPNAEVYVHDLGVRHLVDPTRLWEGTKAAVEDQIRFYGEPKPVPEDRITAIEDGDTIDLGDHVLDVYHAPGHAPHQTVFHDAEHDGVFAADAAGILTPRLDAVEQTSPPPSFDLEGVLEDIEMIQSLDPSALYYGHFGDHPADDRLAEYAEVIQDWVVEVEAARDQFDDEEAIIEHLIPNERTMEVWGERKSRNATRMNARGVLQYLERREE